MSNPMPGATGPDRREAPGSEPAPPARRRRRGSRGGRGRAGPAAGAAVAAPPAPEAAAPRPRIGDTRPAPVPAPAPGPTGPPPGGGRRRRGRRGGSRAAPGAARLPETEPLADPRSPERARGRERKGRPVGRYLMCVQVRPHATQVAVLEGRSLIEHYVSRPHDDATQIDGNIYLGRVQNVLPGMEAAFVDIGTPKNAVLYRGDLRYDRDDVEGDAVPSRRGGDARIEQLLRPGQSIVCQVTKNPIGAKGARLTGEVSLPGRFVVLIPGADTYGISKRLGDDERRRLRDVLDRVRPPGHGLIVRTAAEGASADELARDVARLQRQWEDISAVAARSRPPAQLYQEPDLAVRIIREEFNEHYRGVVIDDRALFEDVAGYVAGISPDLADRVVFFDPAAEPLPLFEHHRVHEQLHRALDRKVWLPSGGSLVIERTEALTVIDVNTGRNVGRSSLEETVYRNNLEAAEEVARQLRLRDIGGIIVIDFIDMEVAQNRADVLRAFREALARDKTRAQAYEISELGLVEMTRKRVSGGLMESLSTVCPSCEGQGRVLDAGLT